MDATTPNTFDFDGADIVVRNGRFKMAYGKECRLIQIHTALKTLLGECPLNVAEGLDYFGTAFNVNAQVGVQVWAANLRKRVLAFPFVRSIASFDFGIDDARRRLDYTLVVETDDGSVSVSSVQSVAEDGELPIPNRPLRGRTFSVGTTGGVYETAKAVARAVGRPVPLENDQDVYRAAKTFAEFLGGTVP